MAFDWVVIKSEFVQGYTDEEGNLICPTLKELAERHGCAYKTIRNRSSNDEENWSQERDIYRTKKGQTLEESKLKLLVGKSAEFSNKILNVVDYGIDDGFNRLKDKDLSNHEYQKITNALSVFQKMGKLELGEPTEHIKEDSSQKHDINFKNNNQNQILEEEGYDDK
jgi:3'-phosphoadenosine 5'-phosphosulfate sulfotransferase (PAPS reductase)/FAD synthetase